ncbi:GNAT family N-acetyltransferase [Devosia sp. A8/3-2]|nr:GNAT family N-acetyltransferase [Devosia sp. A8/3-2]
MTVTTALLIDHEDAIGTPVALYEAQWPDWYNARSASARADLSERLQRDRLPLGIVALRDGVALGACALTASSGGLVTERSPWIGGSVVDPQARRQGVAALLLERARQEARRLGHGRLYALTADAVQLFERQGWVQTDVILMSGEPHRIFTTSL